MLQKVTLEQTPVKFLYWGSQPESRGAGWKVCSSCRNIRETPGKVGHHHSFSRCWRLSILLPGKRPLVQCLLRSKQCSQSAEGAWHAGVWPVLSAEGAWRMEGEQENCTLQGAVTKTHCTAFLSDRIDLRLPGSLCPAPFSPLYSVYIISRVRSRNTSPRITLPPAF